MKADLALPQLHELSEPLLPGAIRVTSALCLGHAIRGIGAAPMDAFIDTGASRSCIPASLCTDTTGAAVLQTIDRARPLDWQGKRSAAGVPVHIVWVRFLGIGPLKLWPFETQFDYFIVGRDLLVHFLTVLDGPHRELGVRATGTLDRWLRSCLRAP